MSDLPWTPDHDCWPVTHVLTGARAQAGAVRLVWEDGQACSFAARLLRENSPDPETIHPRSREMVVLPEALPDDLSISAAHVDATGALVVRFEPEGRQCRYHPGWLRAHSWFETAEEKDPVARLWAAAELPEPPTVDGTRALEDETAFLEWLTALRDYGVARLVGLTPEDGLLERIVRRIGPVRESNFGPMYNLEIKDDPDSNAYTADALPQHIDLPTRECPHGLQFLFCRENSTTGGEGVYCDAYRIAEDMRHEEPDFFTALSTIPWTFNNRARDSDYRASGPIIELDATGIVGSVRYNTFLRAPLRAPLDVQRRAYESVRAFSTRAQDPRYLLVFAYRPGDLLAFDNRRVLHGRKGYDATGGRRFIEGIYSDRDDLHSAIRILERSRRIAEIGA